MLKNISAKLELITHVIPKSNNAHGACSLDEPQPKFFPAINIFELLKKISAKLELITHVIPKSNKAHGACSLDEPQPKFFPAIKIFEFV